MATWHVSTCIPQPWDQPLRLQTCWVNPAVFSADAQGATVRLTGCFGSRITQMLNTCPTKMKNDVTCNITCGAPTGKRDFNFANVGFSCRLSAGFPLNQFWETHAGGCACKVHTIYLQFAIFNTCQSWILNISWLVTWSPAQLNCANLLYTWVDSQWY
jgi:hypothetical protein